jgi:hypothetical protein
MCGRRASIGEWYVYWCIVIIEVWRHHVVVPQVWLVAQINIAMAHET